MQYAALAGRRATCRTRDGRYLFGREFALLHLNRMRSRSVTNLFTFGHRVALVAKTPIPNESRTIPGVGKSGGVGSVVQDNTQQGIIDVNVTIVFDEAQFPEFVHEKINA